MRVLVPEDEVRLATGLKRGLEAEGFAVDVAGTGPDGLWLARENEYAVIPLDIDLHLDPATRAATRGATSADVTAREFAVLVHLMREGDPSLVEGSVRHLRNTVDRPFDRAAIETLRGADYRLAANGG